MKRWTILTSVLIVGIAIAVGVWLFVRVSTDEAVVDTTPSTERRGFLSFFGDRLGFGDDEPLPATTTPLEAPAEPLFREQLRRAQMLPIGSSMLAGATFTTAWEVSSTTGATTTEESVRFVERETAHISDLSLESGEVRRVTNTTIPAIQEAFWGVNASAIALRYLSDDNETVETYVAALATTTPTEPRDLDGLFFPQNISSISLSPAGREVFYITTTNDRASGHVANLSNGGRSTIFSSSLREWTSAWKAPETLFVTTKPSVSATGISYALARSGALARVVSTQGLTTLPNPSGTRVLYSAASASTLNTFVLTLNTQETTTLSVRTLPEKCVWRGDDELICAIPNTIPANTPDAWYQGRTSFNDTLWIIDVVNEQYEFLYAPEDTDARRTMDIVELDLSDDGTIISLINKKDLRGWIADVSATEE